MLAFASASNKVSPQAEHSRSDPIDSTPAPFEAAMAASSPSMIVQLHQSVPGAPPPRHGNTATSSSTVTASSDEEMGLDVEFARKSSGTGLRITFKDLTFSVPSNVKKGETAHLLENVSGFFEPYQMAALMGPSGSGKTTLLDVLAGRKTMGTTQGSILFGGQQPSPAFLRRYTGYVEQFDTLIGTLTVEEMLMYTAELKRTYHEPLDSKREAVDKLIHRLGLDSCRNVRIGDSMSKGISGGQAKRTNIGIALITNPRVLFLDEPTSGLDSFTSNEVMELVKGLAVDGTTICATIHSPSQQAFQLFDRIMMLVRGQVVYFGPRGDPAMVYARTHWTEAIGQHSGQQQFNDAEFLVDIITNADRQGQGKQLALTYQQSELRKENDRLLNSYLEEKEEVPADVAAELAVRKSTATPWWWAVMMLMKYRTLRNYANPQWLGPRIADKILFSIIILTLYLGTGDDYSSGNIVNLSASLFMWCSLPAYGAVAYVPSIVLERRLFIRERADGLYYVISYLLAKILEEILLASVLSIAFSSYVFYGVQYQNAFGVYWLVYFITLSCGITLGYLIAALAPNMDAANAALPAYVTTLLFFAGQLITLNSIPKYWTWYSYIDFLRYSWGALMVNQFESNDPVFSMDGQTVLQYYGLKDVDKWAYVGYLSIFFAVFFTLAYLALSYIRHQKR